MFNFRFSKKFDKQLNKIDEKTASKILSILKVISYPFLIEQGVATPYSNKNMSMLFLKGYLEKFYL